MPAFRNSCEVIVICVIAFLFREFDLDLHDCWIPNTAMNISGHVHLGSARTIRGRGGGNKQGREPTDQIPQIIASTWSWLAILDHLRGPIASNNTTPFLVELVSYSPDRSK